MPELKTIVLNPPLNRTVIRDQAGLDKLKDFFQRCDKVIGWDIETPPLKDFYWRRIRTIQFGNTTEQYVIDLRAFCGDDADVLWKAQGHYGLHLPASLQPVIDTIKPVVCSSDFLKIGVHLGFEYENFYWQLGLRTFHFYDCAIAEKCIWAGGHSLKDYGYYSMEEMMARYFHVQIDKELQQSFTLEANLTEAQFDYACLDTRFPLALRAAQAYILQGETPETLTKKGLIGAAKMLSRIDPLVLGDDLREIAQIENDAIGAFQDMHVHGERLDMPRWLARTEKKKEELRKVIAEELDPVLLPIVGSKKEVISDERVAAAEVKWKACNIASDQEVKLKTAIRAAKLDPIKRSELESQRVALIDARKELKEALKAECSVLKKKRTAIKNLAEKCAGEALINYASRKQLLDVFHGMKGLKNLADTEDETLEKFDHIPVISAFRRFRSLSKEIGTYGMSWITEWKTGPSGEEGWLHPGDHKLHCVFNQYDASTGRSSSDNPNGQNLPKDKEVRSCFIVDPPDESIRISNCCEAETDFVPMDTTYAGGGLYRCLTCGGACDTHAEEYVMVTADMSGAELRILADLADEKVWLDAFARDEDVHAVCTEMMYQEKWPKLQLSGDMIKNKKTGLMTPYWCDYYALNTEADVLKNPLRTLGHPRRLKCACPEHEELRDGTKPVNFGIPYGISPRALAPQIKKSEEAAAELMRLHKAAFPAMHAYIDNAGMMAKLRKKSFDMFGRRRLFPEPTWSRAKEKAKVDREKKLRLEDDEAARNKANFIALHGCKPTKEELWLLTHRLPTNKEIANAFKAMHGSIERQGKNMEIQGTNATIAKLALGSGYDPDGKPFLWHTLPLYKARLIKFVHDEAVVQAPKRYGQQVAALIGDAFKRAAAVKMKKVIMEFDFNIAGFWKK